MRSATTPRVLLLAFLALARQAGAACPADCNGDGVVSADELGAAVDAALGGPTPCDSADPASDGVTAKDLVPVARSAAFGCGRAECAYVAGALPVQTLPPGTPHGSSIPIDHVIVVVQENRSFDHYYGTLPAPSGLPEGASNPRADGTVVEAFHDERLCVQDCDHSWTGSHRAWNLGANDGFVKVNEPGGERAMGWHDEREMPFYRALAATFALSDRHFCSVLGPTFPNRYYLYCGTSFGQTTNANPPLAGWTQKTIFDVLTQQGISWKIYYGDFPFASVFQHLRGSAKVVRSDQFFRDAAAGALPAVAFLDPHLTGASGPQNDEHPPTNPQRGQAFVASVVQAVEASPQWPTTALIVTYDEHGGFYDHVPPPRACPPDAIAPSLQPDDVPGAFDRMGFRVPLIVVSPWARSGHVSHVPHDHAAVLRFIETRFDLPALTARDANADALLDLFDFSSPALLSPPALPPAVLDPDAQARCADDGFSG